MTYCAREDCQKYKDHFESGIYVCSQCENPLFHGKSKYKHSSPWPAFTQPMHDCSLRKEVETEKQTSSDKPALRLFCGKCDNIVGHEFIGDGPQNSSRF
uniref:peptide-methionine (R)-S-oxide reductase n=2 Tax=Hydra vulgaris TaxID=6087 RepID=T2M3N2_HYDVU